MRILIVDDEQPARQRLADQIERMPDHEVVGEAGDGQAALDACGTLRPQIVLLDIRLPGMDGIETARHMSRLKRAPAVIFTTAYDEYAIAAFEAEAIGYLLKPVRQNRLEQALARAERLNRRQLGGLSEARATTRRRHLCARVRDELRLIPSEDVYYFQADRKYVRVRHRKGTDLLDESLKSLEQEFSPDFLRIHRNSLVAVEHLAGLAKDAEGRPVVRFRRIDETLPVSRRHLGGIRKRLRGGVA